MGKPISESAAYLFVIILKFIFNPIFKIKVSGKISSNKIIEFSKVSCSESVGVKFHLSTGTKLWFRLHRKISKNAQLEQLNISGTTFKVNFGRVIQPVPANFRFCLMFCIWRASQPHYPGTVRSKLFQTIIEKSKSWQTREKTLTRWCKMKNLYSSNRKIFNYLII